MSVELPPTYRVDITDPAKAERTRSDLTLGRRFAFCGESLGKPQSGRLARLLGKKGAAAKKTVRPLIGDPVDIGGIRITPTDDVPAQVACLVADRDLYRAEEDTVNLFIAVPHPKPGLRLVVEYAGSLFSEVPLDVATSPSLRDAGVHVETLAMLVAGPYTAQLFDGKHELTSKVDFTVAEYTLAPLSGRLLTHQLDRAAGTIAVSLEVDSYQQPLERELRIELIESGNVIDSAEVTPTVPGRFAASLNVDGEGALRLRLSAIFDPSRVCEVVIPGSRKSERDTTVISELGQEMLLSLMPEPGAVELRGAFLTEGDFLSTPLVLQDVVADTGVLTAKADLQALTLIVWDLLSGEHEVIEAGDVQSGADIAVEAPSSACAIFVGCYASGRPFEAFTHLLRPSRVKLGVDVEHAADGDALEVRLRLNGDRRYQKVPVLLSVRDERLTATDTPQVALSSSMKSGIEGLTAGFDDGAPYIELADESVWNDLRGWLRGPPPSPAALAGDYWDDTAPEMSIELENSPRYSPLSLDDEHDLLDAEDDLFDDDDALLSAESVDLGSVLGAGAPPPPGAAAAPPPAARRLARARSALPSFDDEAEVELDEELDFEEPTGTVSVAELRSDLGAAESDKSVPFLADGFPQGAAMPASAAAIGDPLREVPAPSLPDPRKAFPEVLFYGLVEVDGDAAITLPLGDALGTFTIEAFAMCGTDWAQEKRTVQVDLPVRADLEVPPAVHTADVVTGRLRASAQSGQVRASLSRDGAPVALRLADGAEVAADQVLEGPIDLFFDLVPGTFAAAVTDVASNETDYVEKIVSEPGNIRSLAKQVGILVEGEACTLEDLGDTDAPAMKMRVLPGIDAPFDTLVEATAGYSHLCCEQTAAKILSAVAMYLTSKGAAKRAKAEKIILSGIEREKKMFRPGRAFKMYPDNSYESDHYSSLCVRYLWKLRQLDEVEDLSPQMKKAVAKGLEMADATGQVHGIRRVPEGLKNLADAYTLAVEDPRRAELVRGFIQKHVVVDDEPRMVNPRNKVRDRAELAYAGAALLAIGDLEDGIRVADHLLRQLTDAGRLYSTVDSVALIGLMIQLRKAGVLEGGGTLKVNGKEMTSMEAATFTGPIEHLEVVRGVAIVEVTRVLNERWDNYQGAFELRVGFRDENDGKKTRFLPGDRAELFVELADGYTNGDLVHVCLPASMAWIKGGGRVQRFTVDFEGEAHIRVPVLVTGTIDGAQHFGICVRNMFEEERASSPGLLQVRG